MDDVKKNNTDNPEKITGVIVDSNENILQDQQKYLLYIIEHINRILKDYNIQYAEVVDSRKSHPAFTYNQFIFILSELYTRVYAVNKPLLFKQGFHNIYTNSGSYYDIHKVELAYNIYFKLCFMYGFNCTDVQFYTMTGVSEEILNDWLSVGKSDLLKRIKENAKNGVLSEFENGKIPILKLASANYKHGLTTPIQERETSASVEMLPDLLAIEDQRQE